jgi:putative FmdB family regulatory protein
MPVYDFECQSCGNIDERIEPVDRTTVKCSVCGKRSKRIISAGGVFTANEDAPWIRSVLDVVDKDSKAPHVVAFRNNPTRQNYKAWMKGEGIRPLENPVSGHGEAYEAKQNRIKADQEHASNMAQAIMRRRMERRSIAI